MTRMRSQDVPGCGVGVPQGTRRLSLRGWRRLGLSRMTSPPRPMLAVLILAWELATSSGGWVIDGYEAELCRPSINVCIPLNVGNVGVARIGGLTPGDYTFRVRAYQGAREFFGQWSEWLDVEVE